MFVSVSVSGFESESEFESESDSMCGSLLLLFTLLWFGWLQLLCVWAFEPSKLGC